MSDLGIELAADRRTVRVRVRNTGSRPGEEVVQVYTRAVQPAIRAPRQTLVGFARVTLASGEEGSVDVPLNPRAFELVDEAGHWVAHNGAWELIAAGSCPIPRSGKLGAAEPVRTMV